MIKQTGLTLIELIVTISVFVVLVAIAVPNMQTYARNNRTVTAANAFIGALNLARDEAVKRATSVSVCRSADGESCMTSSSQWEGGWLVFVNGDNDEPAEVDGGEAALRVYAALSPNTTLRPAENFSSFVTYRANGFPQSSGSFVLCDERGATSARVISISRTGHTSTATGAATCTP